MFNDFNIDNFINNFSKNCTKVQKKVFQKNQVITSYIQKRNQFCMLIKGNTKCKNNCKFHQVLSEYLPELILSKVTSLNTRIELLTQRSIRDKLLGYFSILSTRNFNKSFILPFSLTDLADYLSVDRSAMMRELKLLRDEGFIEKNGNKITLKYQ